MIVMTVTFIDVLLSFWFMVLGMALLLGVIDVFLMVMLMLVRGLIFWLVILITVFDSYFGLDLGQFVLDSLDFSNQDFLHLLVSSLGLQLVNDFF